MDNKSLLESYIIKKKNIEEKIKRLNYKESIKEILLDTSHNLHNEVIKLNNIRVNIVRKNIPYLRETLLPFIDSRIISTFNIPSEKIKELSNDTNGDKILDTLDSLSSFELKLVQYTTKVDLSFYYPIRL